MKLAVQFTLKRDCKDAFQEAINCENSFYHLFPSSSSWKLTSLALVLSDSADGEGGMKESSLSCTARGRTGTHCFKRL